MYRSNNTSIVQNDFLEEHKKKPVESTYFNLLNMNYYAKSLLLCQIVFLTFFVRKEKTISDVANIYICIYNIMFLVRHGSNRTT